MEGIVKLLKDFGSKKLYWSVFSSFESIAKEKIGWEWLGES